MSDSLNKTVTFQPHQTKQASPSPATLSTTGRLMSYNDQLKVGLQNGIGFTRLLDQLISTTSTQELFQAVADLTAYHLDTAYIVFPQQYSRSDFYLIFLNRLLDLHQLSGVVLQSSDQYHELYHEYPGINAAGYFVFKFPENDPSGAYYIEKNSQLELFYLDFTKHLLRFNSHTLTQLLLVDYYPKLDHQNIKKFATILLAIGNYLKRDFGFDVDFGLLDPINSCVYQISEPDLPTTIIDQLFVIAAKGGKMLEAGADQSAVLKLDNDVTVTIFREADPQQAHFGEWLLKVWDPQQTISWFDVLLHYQFLRDWYLNNLPSLEIKADLQYFS